ncbi:hypothetical protein U1E44_16330 [Arenibacter sp. GZD96]|jgi:hypothetical protein|uniref:hypothetical protein n=1 Tax=Aurantibrevibacter litoralis TaxID=3106030 RepID=UPI002B000969|nr:hypothetical protein [Arenibacter sp. GZD-96]MEA1787670.1 hypothetical protein [Arenibacter sp. GZD-96]
MKTEIIPYFGFDKIKFGLTLGQTELLLGKSSENNKESYSDNSSDVILKYHNLGFNLTFSSDNDFRLGTITFYSKDFSLKGKKLIGLKETEFVMKSNLIFSDLQLDDDFTELNSKDYTSNSNGISFWINNGIVESISIFPNYQKDNETPIWPN